MIESNDNLFQCMSRMIAEDVDPVSQNDRLWERYGETVAVLVLDSSGFSRTSQSHGIIHFLSRLVVLRDICEQELHRHGSKRFHFEADNTFAAFASAAEAITAALALQRAVHRSGLMLTDSERFRVSMGIGYGRLLYSETLEGYFGDEMNAASRLGEDIARGDEVLITRAARDAATPALLEGFEPRSVEAAGVTIPFYRYQFRPD